MSHEFPRRRDVRDMCEEMLHALMANYNNENEAFDQDFLTGVRDLMREGVPFVDAAAYFAPDGNPSPFALDMFAYDPMDDDLSDLFSSTQEPAPEQGLTIEAFRKLRDQLRANSSGGPSFF